MMTAHDTCRSNGLTRPRDGRILAGVCAGLGQRFGLDPWTARLLFVLVLLVIPGSQILMYPILWIVMPPETGVSGLPDPVKSAQTIPPAATM